MATKLVTNPETGETLALIGGQWQPAKLAENDKGEKMFLGDGGWEAFPAPERSTGTRALRAAEFGARGFMDSAAETLGAVPDLLNRGLRYAGVPVPGEDGGITQGIKSGLDAAGRFISSPINALFDGADLGPNKPETTGEKFAHGAGRGAADAASMMLPAAAVARGARAGSATQGVAQALAAQPGTQLAAGAVGGAVGEATDRPMLGMAAALATPAVPAGARRMISPVPIQLTPEEARRAAMAQGMGIELTPGQQTGSRPLQALESSLTQLPFSSGRQSAIYDAQRQGFNREALGRAGVNADRASPDVIDGAFRRLGRQFDDLAARTTVHVDPQFEAEVGRVIQEHGRRLPTDVAPVFQSYIDDLTPLIAAVRNGQAPQIDGRTYQNISSNIGKRARAARDNPALQTALNGLRDALDNVMERSANVGANPNTPRLPTQSGAPPAPSSLADEWRETRGQYRNLLAIDNAAAGGTQADRAAGNLPFGGFRQAVKAQDPNGAGRGRGPMADLGEVADFLAAKIPNSGTPERTSMMRLAQGGGMFGVSGGTAAMGGADLMLSALMGAGALAGPAVMQTFINSPVGRTWLTNQAMAGIGPQMNSPMVAALLGAQAKGQLLAPPQ